MKQRTIAGAAYWFPHQGSVSAALLVDVETLTFDDFSLARPAERRVGVHALVGF